MADDVRVTNFPETGEGQAAVYMWQQLTGNLPTKSGKEEIEQQLMLFLACRQAARGYTYDISKL